MLIRYLGKTFGSILESVRRNTDSGFPKQFRTLDLMMPSNSKTIMLIRYLGKSFGSIQSKKGEV